MPKFTCSGIALLAVSIPAILPAEQLCTPQSTADQERGLVAERQHKISGYRTKARDGKHKSFSLIGDLVTKGYWKQVLPLEKQQALEITKLDALLRDARVQSWLDDAQYLEESPSQDVVPFREYVARSEARRQEARWHAECLVRLGLLTESQAALVIQRRLVSLKSNALHNRHAQELLGMTERQKEEMRQVGLEVRRQESRLNLFSVNAGEQKEIADRLASIQRDHGSAALAVLTHDQREIWSRLTTELSLPPEPPDLPALSESEDARIHGKDLSPTFRILTENTESLRLTEQQQAQLKDLEEVTRAGLCWMTHRQQTDAQAAQARARFVTHAEQVALQGLLSEHQAAEVQSQLNRK